MEKAEDHFEEVFAATQYIFTIVSERLQKILDSNDVVDWDKERWRAEFWKMWIVMYRVIEKYGFVPTDISQINRTGWPNDGSDFFLHLLEADFSGEAPSETWHFKDIIDRMSDPELGDAGYKLILFATILSKVKTAREVATVDGRVDKELFLLALKWPDTSEWSGVDA